MRSDNQHEHKGAFSSRYLPPVIWMGMIFVLSAQPYLSSGLSSDFVLRKLAHMTVFGVLLLLWLRTFRYHRLWLAFTLTLLYAASDEFHQHFVTGRHSTWTDVLIDGLGTIVAWLLWISWTNRKTI